MLMISAAACSVSVWPIVSPQGEDEPRAAIGEGRGVISTRGPIPGEEKAEPGESDAEL